MTLNSEERLSIWLIGIVGGAFVAFSIALGIYFVRPGWEKGGFRGEIGVALMTGAVVSVAILFLQIANDLRLDRAEKRRALITMIGTSTTLDGIDLSGRNLEDLHLGSKSFVDADFDGSKLTHANMSRSQFDNASFVGAHIAGANLFSSDLRGAHFERADLSDAKLHSACLREADLRGADLSGAQLTATDVWLAFYDSKTSLPETLPWPRPPDCTKEKCQFEDEQAYLYPGTCEEG